VISGIDVNGEAVRCASARISRFDLLLQPLRSFELMGRKLRQRFSLRSALGWLFCRASRRVGSRNPWRRQINGKYFARRF